MTTKLALLSLLLVLGTSLGVLYSQSTQKEALLTKEQAAPYLKVEIAPGFHAIPKLEPEMPRRTVMATKGLEIPEGVNLQSILEQLSTLSYEASDREWKALRDPQQYRARSWCRSVQKIELKARQIEITVLVSLALEEVAGGMPFTAGSSTEVYRLLPDGTLELIEKEPHTIRGGMSF